MVDGMETQLVSYGSLMMAFALGGVVSITSGWIGSLYTHKAHMKDHNTVTDDDLTLEEIEEEIDYTDYETREQREAREEQLLEDLRGQL